MQQQKNYRALIAYLNEKNIRLTKSEFIGTLHAIDNMTVYGTTKKEAIDFSAKIYKISKNKMNSIIKGMGITSERFKEAKKEFAKYRAIEEKEFKNKLKNI